MIADILFKAARKLLPGSLYSGISRSIFGREKGWKRIGTYSATFAFYKEKAGALEGKRVLEIGAGEQYYTALFFLASHAKDVHLVEPKWMGDDRKFELQLAEFNQANPDSPLDESVKRRIFHYRDISDIPADCNGAMDVACSYLVLEHVPDLGPLFLHMSRLLKPGGIGCHLVDLSDHTYHIFAKYRHSRRILETRYLYHLRYSNRVFGWLNDPKCYMNRRLLPEYLELVKANNLVLRKIDKQVFEKAIVHPDLLHRHSGAQPADFKVLNFYLEVGKRP